MQPGCLMKILEVERWLKGTNFRKVAFLQRGQDESDAGAPHPGARKVEGRDACRECEDMVATQGGHPPFKGDSPHLHPQPSRAESSPTRSKVLPLRHRGWVPRCRRFDPGGSLDRRVNCRRVPQPRWVGARRSAKGRRSRRKTGVKGETHSLRVCPAPRSGALAVGGYKHPRGREREA
jgi:hypothetical protein